MVRNLEKRRVSQQRYESRRPWRDRSARNRHPVTRAHARAWREAHPEYMRDWRAKHIGGSPGDPAKRKARRAVSMALAKGLLVRLDCEMCRSSIQVEAHHAFGYEPEMALAVWWICRPHHLSLHRN